MSHKSPSSTSIGRTYVYGMDKEASVNNNNNNKNSNSNSVSAHGKSVSVGSVSVMNAHVSRAMCGTPPCKLRRLNFEGSVFNNCTFKFDV